MLRDGDGAPIAKNEVGVELLEREGDVATWLQHGILTSSTGGLTTDDQGALIIGGLPEGRLRVHALSQSHEIEVRAGELADVAIEGHH